MTSPIITEHEFRASLDWLGDNTETVAEARRKKIKAKYLYQLNKKDYDLMSACVDAEYEYEALANKQDYHKRIVYSWQCLRTGQLNRITEILSGEPA